MAVDSIKKIRSFIAVDISDEARDEFSRVENRLKRSGCRVRWVRPETVHITLKFLGYIEEGRIAGISERIRSVASSNRRFEIIPGRIGVFPDWRRAKVLWVGIDKGIREMKKIAEDVENAMAEEGFERERKAFNPHFTLGRIKTPENLDKLEAIAGKTEVAPVSIPVSKLILVRSELSSGGPVYTPLFEAGLKIQI